MSVIPQRKNEVLSRVYDLSIRSAPSKGHVST